MFLFFFFFSLPFFSVPASASMLARKGLRVRCWGRSSCMSEFVCSDGTVARRGAREEEEARDLFLRDLLRLLACVLACFYPDAFSRCFRIALCERRVFYGARCRDCTAPARRTEGLGSSRVKPENQIKKKGLNKQSNAIFPSNEDANGTKNTSEVAKAHPLKVR